MVVDSSSIEVNRRRRRAKTDRLDAEKLLSMLMRWANGEETVWSVINPPTPEEEDARQLHRELDVLKREQTRHSNRIKGLLAGIGVDIPVDRNFPQQLQKAEQWDGSPVPDGLRCRLFREFERMQLLNRQIRQLEQQRADRIREQEANPTVEKVRRLLRLRALGPASSWLFVHEVFGWREVQNRRQLASLLGLVPTPYNSGNSQRDQGISKSGNQRMRTMAIEIAWCWVRFQPDSRLSRWYMQRFGGGSRRQRRIGIVALARKLMVAIWKYLKEGEIPDGARMQDSPTYHFSYTPSLS